MSVQPPLSSVGGGTLVEVGVDVRVRVGMADSVGGGVLVGLVVNVAVAVLVTVGLGVAVDDGKGASRSNASKPM